MSKIYANCEWLLHQTSWVGFLNDCHFFCEWLLYLTVMSIFSLSDCFCLTIVCFLWVTVMSDNCEYVFCEWLLCLTIMNIFSVNGYYNIWQLYCFVLIAIPDNHRFFSVNDLILVNLLWFLPWIPLTSYFVNHGHFVHE